NKLKAISHTERVAIIENLNLNIQSKLVSSFLKDDPNLFDNFIVNYSQLKLYAINETYYKVDFTMSEAIEKNKKNLNLKQALLINDILNNNRENLEITDISVSPVVNKFLTDCANFKKTIAQNKKIKIDNKKNKKREEDKTEKRRIATEKEYNSYSAQFKRIFTQYQQSAAPYKKPLAIGTTFIGFCAFLAYYFSDQLKTLIFLKYFNIFKA